MASFAKIFLQISVFVSAMLGALSQESLTSCSVDALRNCSTSDPSTNLCCKQLQDPLWNMSISVQGLERTFLRRDDYKFFRFNSLSANERKILKNKQELVRALSALFVQTTSLDKSGSRAVKLTSAVDRILEKIRNDTCSWLMRTLSVQDSSLSCSDILYRVALDVTSDELINNTEDRSQPINYQPWVLLWQERTLCREVPELSTGVDLTRLPSCN